MACYKKSIGELKRMYGTDGINTDRVIAILLNAYNKIMQEEGKVSVRQSNQNVAQGLTVTD